jgi:C1A family cysteine protease
MSELKIHVESVKGLEGYPLAYTVYDRKEIGLVLDGIVGVGETVTVSLDTAAEYQVQLYLPGRPPVSQTVSGNQPVPVTAIFRVEEELQALRRDTGPTAAPVVVLPPAGAGLFGLAQLSLEWDPLLVDDPLLPREASPGVTAFEGLVSPPGAWRQQVRIGASAKTSNLSRPLPGIAFVVRPFVRLWELAPGAQWWRVDPASAGRLTDTADGQRLVKTPPRAQYCVEVGTPGGPNQFVYLPPGPFNAEIRARDVPVAGTGPSQVELVVCSQPLADLLLAYARAGAHSQVRLIARLARTDSKLAWGGNTALVLAYACLRSLELDRVADWLKVLEQNQESSPDTHVLEGWRALRRETPDLAAAQRSFVKAGQGPSPPVYTEGLRLLIDGLELFAPSYAKGESVLDEAFWLRLDGPLESDRANQDPDLDKALQKDPDLDKALPKDPGLDEAIERARAWGRAADWANVLTTMICDRPDVPQLGSRSGAPTVREVFRPFQSPLLLSYSGSHGDLHGKNILIPTPSKATPLSGAHLPPSDLLLALDSLGYQTLEEALGVLHAAGPQLAQTLGLPPESLKAFTAAALNVAAPGTADELRLPSRGELNRGRAAGQAGTPKAAPDLRARAPAAAAAAPTPAAVDHLRHMPPVRDQGSRGTDVAFAAVAAYEHFLRANGLELDLSEQFLYWSCKAHDGLPGGEGTRLRVAFKRLRQDGCCLEDTWPYSPTPAPGNEGQGPPPVGAAVQALNYRLSRYRTLSPTSVADLKATLVSGRCVSISVPVYDSFLTNPLAEKTGNIPNPVPGELAVGGHALCIVGYADEPTAPGLGGGRFVVRNSWGKAFGAASTYGPGYGTISYSYIAHLCQEAFAVD